MTRFNVLRIMSLVTVSSFALALLCMTVAAQSVKVEALIKARMICYAPSGDAARNSPGFDNGLIS